MLSDKSPYNTEKPDYQKAQKKALDLLDKFGYDEPPVDPVKICRELGIRVYFVNFKEDNDNISGFFYGKKNEIYINKEEHPNRQTFTAAHELGHKLLHEDWLNSQDYQVLLRDSTSLEEDFREKEANAFAVHLLVPKAMLDKYYRIASIDELSTLFMVSSPVIRNRIRFEYDR